MSEFVSGLGLWAWIGLGLALMALETAVPGVHFLWFGLAAVLVGALGFALDGAGLGAWFSLPWQLVLFAAISVVAVFWVRGVAGARTAVTDEPDLNSRLAQYKGRIVIVEEPIAGGRGKVRVGDTLWPAEGPDAVVGARMRVTGASGSSLTVEMAPSSGA